MQRGSPVAFLRLAVCVTAVAAAVLSCSRSDQAAPVWTLVPPWVGQGPPPANLPTAPATTTPLLNLLPTPRLPGELFLTPTPDLFRTPPPLRTEAVTYVVRPGDSVNAIAVRFSVGANLILSANTIPNPDSLWVGQVLLIPPPIPQAPGPSFKIVPDSELIHGPAAAFFDLPSFAAQWDSYLTRYTEEVEGRWLSGPGIVQLVAQRYSVNPRLLLAVLEHQSGWVTRSNVPTVRLTYPMGFVGIGYEGLFSQLSWAADQLNAGYYRWRSGWAGPYILLDGSVILPGQGINAGTAGVQHLFAQLYRADAWRQVVGEGGFYAIYQSLFGIPFDLAVEPLVPPGLTQPPMQLPFEPGTTWSFTSGPHGAWGSGSAWAALDFAPPGDALGCVLSDEWVVASADGLVLRADQGEVILDLDGDGLEQTGWVLLYMHIESRDRVVPGTFLRAGDRIGHPSCEGGFSNGTHVHMARKYNGEWIPADVGVPFDLEGWISAGLGQEYDGALSRGGVVLEACACRFPGNQIAR
jgi:LysM repeat protein